MDNTVKQKGIILPVTLWVVITIIAVVATYSSIVRTSITTVNNVKDDAKKKYISESYAYREIHKLHTSMVNRKAIRRISKSIVKEDGYIIHTEVIPETMKLNINTASKEELVGMLSRIGLDDGEINRMTAEILQNPVHDYDYRNTKYKKYKDSREIDEIGYKYGVENMSRHMTVYRNAGTPVYSIYVSIVKQGEENNKTTVVYSLVNRNITKPYQILRWES